MVPYLSDEEVSALVNRCAQLLSPGGRLVFLEQDLLTDAVSFPDFALLSRVFAKDERALKRTVALGLRPLFRAAGLKVEPRSSFLWTDDAGGNYTRELLGKVAEDALKAGRITEAERRRWDAELDALSASGDFYYGLVYHRVMGVNA